MSLYSMLIQGLLYRNLWLIQHFAFFRDLSKIQTTSSLESRNFVGWQKDQTVIYVRITRAEEAIKIWVGNPVPTPYKFFVNSNYVQAFLNLRF